MIAEIIVSYILRTILMACMSALAYIATDVMGIGGCLAVAVCLVVYTGVNVNFNS